jgi:hypothetical protein
VENEIKDSGEVEKMMNAVIEKDNDSQNKNDSDDESSEHMPQLRSRIDDAVVTY